MNQLNNINQHCDISFVDRAKLCGANSVRMQFYLHRCTSYSTNAYNVNIPFDEYIKIMERASRHLAYSPRQIYTTEYRSKSGMVAEFKADTHRFGVHQDTVLQVDEISGANVVCLFQHKVFSHTKNSFSWNHEDLLDVRYCDKLNLRVNPWTTLVFETVKSADTLNRTIYLVYIQLTNIDKIPLSEVHDVQRTVENTVQAVMMGSRLKQKPKVTK